MNTTELLIWKEKNLKGVQIPDRYDLTLSTMQPLLDYATQNNPDKESIFHALCAVFTYGFERGMAYGKAQTKKAALHAANMKDGTECPVDEN